jgi:nicotinamidase-related amidase
MAIWDDIIPQEDLKMFDKAKMGGEIKCGNKPAIIVVDMTYGFVDDNYPLGCSKMGWPAVYAVQKLIGKGRKANIPIFYTRELKSNKKFEKGRWKYQGKMNTGLLDEKEIQIPEEIKPINDEVLIEKIYPSAFFNTNLISMLIYAGVDTLIITGMTTSGCVRATVVDAFSYNFTIIVPEECVGDRGLISHKISLFDMAMKYANVAPLNQVLSYIDGCK